MSTRRAPALSGRSSLAEVAAAVAAALASAKIDAVLTGGACASLHTNGRYESRDLDFVVTGAAPAAQLGAAMAAAGFRRRANYYAHRRTRFFVEFVPAPLAIDADTAVRPVVRVLHGRRVRLLSPTDSCRDRLAAFYHWSDRQSLGVAIEIALANRLRMGVIERWSRAEGHARDFAEFAETLAARRRERSRRRVRGSDARSRRALGLAAVVMIAALAAGCGGGDGNERNAQARDAGAPNERRGSASDERPNILLVTIDTFRADHLHAAGYARETTPVIDSLAAAGALFLQAISQAPQTAPSHASLLTGAYPPAHTVRSNGTFALPDEATTIAEILRESGYATGAFVGAFVLDRRFGFAQGFDAFGDSMRAPGASASAAHDAGVAAGAPDRTDARARAWYGNIVEGGFERRAGAVTDDALQWLAARERSSPFFLWVHYYDPHAPYEPPHEHDVFPKRDPAASYAQWEALDAERAGAAARGDGHSPESDEHDNGTAPGRGDGHSPDSDEHDDGAATGSRPSSGEPAAGAADPAASERGVEMRAAREALREDMIALYDGELRYCDAQVGRLLDALRGRGAASSTLVIVTSDHGESLGENDYDFRHGWYLFDDVVRVPLVVSEPGGIAPGTVVREQVELTSVFDTIRDAALGSDHERGVSMSLVERARSKAARKAARGGAGDDAAAGAELAYSETFLRKQLVGGPPLFAVRSPRWKYVEPIQEPGRTRRWLYDLAADPAETRNLAKQGPEMAAVADSMSALLRAILAASEGAAVAGAHEIAPDEATIERLRALGYIE